jgi:hypothetical protein
MSAVSGQYGTVQIGSSEIVECTGWSLNKKASVHTYASCSTGGFKAAVAGTKSCDGSVSGMWDPADQIDDHLEVGSGVSLKLYTTASLFSTVPAVIETLAVEVDLDDGEIVNWEAGFQGNGAWTNPT